MDDTYYWSATVHVEDGDMVEDALKLLLRLPMTV